MSIVVRALAPSTFPDYEALTRDEGGGGCYCAFWHQKFASHDAWLAQCRERPEANCAAIRAKIDAGFHVGVVAYDEETARAIAWVSVAPLPEIYWAWKRVAALGVEAADTAGIVCFTLGRDERGRGRSASVLAALARYGATRGWKRLEGYPFDAAALEKHGDDVLWPGRPETFASAGFERIGAHWLEHADYPRSIWRRDLATPPT